jgi:hypothetical protein
MHGIVKDNIYVKYESDQQQLELGGNSWTIDLQELPQDIMLIEYITPKTRYVITRTDAFKHGFIRKLGGEDKLIVPLKWWAEGAVALNDNPT